MGVDGRVSDAEARDLIRRLGRMLDRAVTVAGHLAQLVAHEHRGHCTVQGCTPGCREAQALRLEVRLYLLATRAGGLPTVPRATRCVSLPMTRRVRGAAPGRRLPPAPARGRAPRNLEGVV
jgi:hypothetical protein